MAYFKAGMARRGGAVFMSYVYDETQGEYDRISKRHGVVR